MVVFEPANRPTFDWRPQWAYPDKLIKEKHSDSERDTYRFK